MEISVSKTQVPAMRGLLPLCLILACCVLSGSCTNLTCANSCCANSNCLQSCQACVVPGNCRNPILQLTQVDPSVMSPFYEQVQVLDTRNQQIDNCCLTYFLITKSSKLYLVFRSCVFKNGTNYVDTYISGPVRDCPGVTRLQGVESFEVINGCSSCVSNSYVLGAACDGTFVAYRCYHSGDCDAIDANQEVRTGLSSYRDLSECCKDRIIALANQQPDVFYLKRDFYKLPGKLNRCCVKYFNGAQCINGGNINDVDAISMPGKVPCSQDWRSEL